MNEETKREVKRLEPGHRQLLVKDGLPLTAKFLFGPWPFAWTDSKYIYGDVDAFYIYNHYGDRDISMSEISKPIPRSSDAGQAIRALLEAAKGKEWDAEVGDNG